MEFFITDLENVAVTQSTKGITKTLSIIEFNPEKYYAKNSISENTHIKVDDHEWVVNDKSPNMLTVEKIVRFARSLNPDDKVLIHCFAGISRSTAAAIIVLYEHEKDVEFIEKSILAMRPRAAPNRLIAKLADDFYGHKTPILLDIAKKLNDGKYDNISFNKGYDI